MAEFYLNEIIISRQQSFIWLKFYLSKTINIVSREQSFIWVNNLDLKSLKLVMNFDHFPTDVKFGITIS